MLFWIFFLMFYFSYLFSVMFLASFVLVMMLLYMGNVMFLKFLVILVYLSGIVIFILYISCMCWNISKNFSLWFCFFGLVMVFMFDYGMKSTIYDVGEYMWMYLLFSFIFNSLVASYSLNLFKISGSLRF